MALLKLMSVILLLFLVDSATSHRCSWTHFRLGKLNEDSTTFLKTMGGEFPWGCLDEKGKLMFPEDAFKSLQTEDLAAVALEVLKNVAKIFKNNVTSAKWDREKFNIFKNILSRQVENLGKCEFSECAWEIVRHELHYTLKKFGAFLKKGAKQ
ncbi:interferon a3-like [Chanos chanos]|uniref:Interferon a3-like n=1 Tax=Chanos chanos TaxID=29144 RepID=A0A6J2X0B6_CHACN|nr:interferon a3-like [Chanos chanos]